MKFAFVLFAIITLALSLFLLQKTKSNKIAKNKATTTGKVVKIFYRGKLPFCEYKYQVNGVTYLQKQKISKNNSKKILNNSYTVFYEKGNPKNAFIKFN